LGKFRKGQALTRNPSSFTFFHPVEPLAPNFFFNTFNLSPQKPMARSTRSTAAKAAAAAGASEPPAPDADGGIQTVRRLVYFLKGEVD
jgi:hypothetical protein